MQISWFLFFFKLYLNSKKSPSVATLKLPFFQGRFWAWTLKSEKSGILRDFCNLQNKLSDILSRLYADFIHVEPEIPVHK